MSLHPFLIDASRTMYSSSDYAGPGAPRQLMQRTAHGEVTVIADGFEVIDGMNVGADGAIDVAGPFSPPSFGEDAMGIVSVRMTELSPCV